MHFVASPQHQGLLAGTSLNTSQLEVVDRVRSWDMLHKLAALQRRRRCCCYSVQSFLASIVPVADAGAAAAGAVASAAVAAAGSPGSSAAEASTHSEAWQMSPPPAEFGG